MEQREWTGSVAVLPEAVRELAVKMANLANQGWREENLDQVQKLEAFLRDEAYTLNEWADAIEQLYARRDESLNAQGLALARLMAGRRGERVTVITNATFTLAEGWWLVTFECGFECGIAPDGSVSS